jgi:hypothetical protein
MTNNISDYVSPYEEVRIPEATIVRLAYQLGYPNLAAALDELQMIRVRGRVRPHPTYTNPIRRFVQRRKGLLIPTVTLDEDNRRWLAVFDRLDRAWFERTRGVADQMTDWMREHVDFDSVKRI